MARRESSSVGYRTSANSADDMNNRSKNVEILKIMGSGYGCLSDAMGCPVLAVSGSSLPLIHVGIPDLGAF